MELHWIISQVEKPGPGGEGRFGRDDHGSVSGMHKSVIPVRYSHGNVYLESRRYLAPISKCGIC